MTLITGIEIKQALLNSHACLSNEKEKIDALNVFPVPDGDTGTNMLLTYKSGIEAIVNLEEKSASKLMKVFSRGLLMGARGNSGVILSQIFRGISKSFEGKDEINSFDVVEAFVEARETAYKAVMNPVEGTILTVISDMSKDVYKYKNQSDLMSVINQAVEAGEKSLANTPNLLPVLKEAGVVDSGGYGLMVIFKGIRDYFEGNITVPSEEVQVFDNLTVTGEPTEFGYCTEFIIELDSDKAAKNNFSEEMLKQQLVKLGDSLVVVHDEDIVKVHVHTLVPGEALNIGQRYGEFLKLKIENMTVQHEEIISANAPVNKSKYAVCSVSPGNGISEHFKSIGVTHIVDGGQSMNPSTNDFVKIIESANAENVIILPNNSNIILAATQAKELVESSSDIKVEVLPTKSIIQGITALAFFNDQADLSDNFDEMLGSLEDVKYGELTYAVRNTVMNDVEIKEGEYIAIFEKNIIKSSTDKHATLCELVEKMIDEDSSIITLVYGNDVSEEELAHISECIEEKYDDFDFELVKGDQDIYSYFVGVE